MPAPGIGPGALAAGVCAKTGATLSTVAEQDKIKIVATKFVRMNQPPCFARADCYHDSGGANGHARNEFIDVAAQTPAVKLT
jgi:hypothetical protein